MIRYPIATAFLAVLVGIGLGQATAAVGLSLDATWWRSLGLYQVTAVEAATSGYQSGFIAGQWAAVFRLTHDIANPRFGVPLANRIELSNEEGRSVGVARFGKTFGTYIHEVGDFYVNHENASATPIGDIISCLVDNAQIDCDDLAKNSRPAR